MLSLLDQEFESSVIAIEDEVVADSICEARQVAAHGGPRLNVVVLEVNEGQILECDFLVGARVPIVVADSEGSNSEPVLGTGIVPLLVREEPW